MEDCFDKILSIYENSDLDKYKLLNQLMNNFKKQSDVIKIRNCIIFLAMPISHYMLKVIFGIHGISMAD